MTTHDPMIHHPGSASASAPVTANYPPFCKIESIRCPGCGEGHSPDELPEHMRNCDLVDIYRSAGGHPETEALDAQLDRLAKVISVEVPGEPSRGDEGTVDCAIRLIRAAYVPETGILDPTGASVKLALPADPKEMLSDDDRQKLREDLDRTARGRREAEAAAANLTLRQGP